MRTQVPGAFSQDIIERLLQEMVLHPKYIRVWRTALGRSVTFKAQVHRGDMPRVIGKAGVYAKAFGGILTMIGRRDGLTQKINFEEPTVGEPDRYDDFSGRDSWDRETALRLAEDICEAIFENPCHCEVLDGDEFMSLIQVTTSQRESRPLIEQVERNMQPLFSAIGNKNGRRLSVNIAPREVAAATR